MTLDQAAGNYRTALALLTEAEHQRAQAHAAHIDTIPLLGRVHVGNGSEPTRKAHHRACTAAAEARTAWKAARDELVAGALEAAP